MFLPSHHSPNQVSHDQETPDQGGLRSRGDSSGGLTPSAGLQAVLLPREFPTFPSATTSCSGSAVAVWLLPTRVRLTDSPSSWVGTGEGKFVPHPCLPAT